MTTYPYRDECGNVIYEVVRRPGKSFSARRPDGSGGWVNDIKGVRRVLYRLPEVVKSPIDAWILIAEGEKDADNLAKMGFIATTNVFGAKRWRSDYSRSLRGRRVAILPDNDSDGRAHAKVVTKALRGVARDLRVISLPDLPEKGDVSDWIAAGGTADELRTMIEATSSMSSAIPSAEKDASSGETDDPDDPDGISGTSHTRAQADVLVQLADQAGVEMFHDSTGRAWTRFDVKGHEEIHAAGSSAFQQFLAHLAWTTTGKAPNSNALSTARNTLEGRARFEGPEIPLHVRVAGSASEIWYDLTDSRWRAVRIRPGSWSVIDRPPTMFRRHSHQMAQIEPKRGGDLRRFLEFVNVASREHQILLLVYLVSCLIPDIPHPILTIHGHHGTAKTTLSRLLRWLVDPSVTDVLTLPTRPEEFVQQLHHHWLAPYDNITSMPVWASDTLCRAATGGGHTKRMLYTDEDDIVLNFRRCAILNGINVAARRPDLLDRCVLIELETIPEDRRRQESEFLRAFDRERPRLVGAMFDAVAAAMRIRPSIELDRLPRMADFAVWGCAIAEALGYTRHEFLDAYSANYRLRNEEVLSSSVVAGLVVQLMSGRDEWIGTPSELYRDLKEIAKKDDVDLRDKEWPKAANVLSGKLNELKVNLDQIGIQIAHDRRVGRRGLSIVRSPRNIVRTVRTVQTQSNQQLSADDIADDPDDNTVHEQSPTGQNGLTSCPDCGGADFWIGIDGQRACGECSEPPTAEFVDRWVHAIGEAEPSRERFLV